MYFVQDAHSFWNWIYFVMLIVVSLDTVCPESSDPFYIVTYYKNGSLLPGHTVQSPENDPNHLLRFLGRMMFNLKFYHSIYMCVYF